CALPIFSCIARCYFTLKRIFSRQVHKHWCLLICVLNNSNERFVRNIFQFLIFYTRLYIFGIKVWKYILKLFSVFRKHLFYFFRLLMISLVNSDVSYFVLKIAYFPIRWWRWWWVFANVTS